MSHPTTTGSEDIFRCKNVNKRGFEKCETQCKVSFPGLDQSVLLFISNDDHKHEQIDVETGDRFTWKSQPEAEAIVKVGVDHNDYPAQIMKALDEAGVVPLPSYTQLNNKIVRVRAKCNQFKSITTSGELEEALTKYTDVPDEINVNEPFVNDYKIEILPCGKKARFWFNITTHNLIKRITSNEAKLFQIDGTYKLIWVPNKENESWCVQVH